MQTEIIMELVRGQFIKHISSNKKHWAKNFLEECARLISQYEASLQSPKDKTGKDV